jgi:hypothetical protein
MAGTRNTTRSTILIFQTRGAPILFAGKKITLATDTLLLLNSVPWLQASTNARPPRASAPAFSDPVYMYAPGQLQELAGTNYFSSFCRSPRAGRPSRSLTSRQHLLLPSSATVPSTPASSSLLREEASSPQLPVGTARGQSTRKKADILGNRL